MRGILFNCFIILSVLLNPLVCSAGSGMCFSVIPNDGKFIFYCEFINKTSAVVEIPACFMINDNTIYSRFLSGSDTEFISAGWEIDIDKKLPSVNVLPDSNRVERVKKIYFSSRLEGEYEECNWGMRVDANNFLFSSNLVVGCKDSIKGLRLPKARDFGSKSIPKLAFVFDESDAQADEIAFIRSNSGVTTNLVSGPFCGGNEIILETLTHVSTNSLRNLESWNTDVVRKSIPPGECVEWRYLWRDLTNALPHNVHKAIRNAGHVKFRWKCGDLISDPLSLWLKEE